MTPDARRAYMREYMRVYRVNHPHYFSIYERARYKLRKLKLTTQEQETAKRAHKILMVIAGKQAIADHRAHRLDQSDEAWALGYAIKLIEALAREPMGEGFGNLKPPTGREGK